MKITRMDLADTGSPEGLVRLILENEPSLTMPVPIEELAYQLDIIEIKELETDGFEGGLITDSARTQGVILVNKNANSVRRRFTIGHELGHFLIANHVPSQEGKFLCSKSDFNILPKKEVNRRQRMEIEANRFSSLLLMPPPWLKAEFIKDPKPRIEHIFNLASIFKVSREAMARSYVASHPENIAIIIVKNKKIIRQYRSKKQFPYIDIQNNQSVPLGSHYNRKDNIIGRPSDADEVSPELWLSLNREDKGGILVEQVCLQNNDCGMIMLKYEASEEDFYDEFEDMTSKERWHARNNNVFENSQF